MTLKVNSGPSAAQKVLLVAIQPSSASTKCAFSLLNSFNEQQMNSLEDYVEVSLMSKFNRVQF